MLTIYGSPDCRLCKLTLDLVNKLGVSFVYLDVNKDEAIQDMFKARGFTTVPQIFDGTLHIGGYREFVKTVDVADIVS